MKKLLILIYVIGGAGYTVYSIIQEIYPALFWLDIFAPNPGDKYPIVLVGLLTYLIILLPLFILLIIVKLIRKFSEKEQKAEGSGVWIIRKKQLQSALLEIPIYINDVKIGGIDSGKIKFFEAPVGQNILQAGKGKSASEKLQFTCNINEQLYYRLRLEEAGLIVKYVLEPISAEDGILNSK